MGMRVIFADWGERYKEADYQKSCSKRLSDKLDQKPIKQYLLFNEHEHVFTWGK